MHLCLVEPGLCSVSGVGYLSGSLEAVVERAELIQVCWGQITLIINTNVPVIQCSEVLFGADE